MSGELHKKLIEIGRKYLLNHQISGFCKSSIVASEIVISCGECADVIGWSNAQSILLEAKTSREDFKKDSKKWFRMFPERGVGDLRLYIAPKGLIKIEELPEYWGLIEVNEKLKPRMVQKPVKQKSDKRAEILILSSIIKRIGQNPPEGVSIKCYVHETKNNATLTLKNEEGK